MKCPSEQGLNVFVVWLAGKQAVKMLKAAPGHIYMKGLPQGGFAVAARHLCDAAAIAKPSGGKPLKLRSKKVRLFCQWSPWCPLIGRHGRPLVCKSKNKIKMG